MGGRKLRSVITWKWQHQMYIVAWSSHIIGAVQYGMFQCAQRTTISSRSFINFWACASTFNRQGTPMKTTWTISPKYFFTFKMHWLEPNKNQYVSCIHIITTFDLPNCALYHALGTWSPFNIIFSYFINVFTCPLHKYIENSQVPF